MNIKIKEIKGFKAAFTSMFMSKRTYNDELGEEIDRVCDMVLDFHGYIFSDYLEHYRLYCEHVINLDDIDNKEAVRSTLSNKDNLNKIKTYLGNEYNESYCVSEVGDNDFIEVMYCMYEFRVWLKLLCKMGRRHITVLRFLSFSCVVEGLHRGAQDDFDAHAKRLENKIIRNSTRLATFNNDEMSDYYKDKIILMDDMLNRLNIELPNEVMVEGFPYVRSTNGYIRKDLVDNKDVKRGLYPLCIPSSFVFECNLTEWAHIVKERDINSGAHPELKDMVEMVNDSLEEAYDYFNRKLWAEIKN